MDLRVKKYILWDHDGVLVDTEKWYYEATRKALAEIGIEVPPGLYLHYMEEGRSLWTLAEERGISGEVISLHRSRRNDYYQEYLLTENLEIEGVVQVLEALSRRYSMAIVTTSKKRDFELIHREQPIVRYMDFVLTIEDSGRGLKSAFAAGIDCIIVDNPLTRTHDFTAAAAIMRDILELSDFLLAEGA